MQSVNLTILLMRDIRSLSAEMLIGLLKSPSQLSYLYATYFLTGMRCCFSVIFRGVCMSVYIDITAALRAVLNIARACVCNILYLHEGASPRRRYFRIARRAQRARVLYDSSALEARNDIVYIHQRALLKCSCNATN